MGIQLAQTAYPELVDQGSGLRRAAGVLARVRGAMSKRAARSSVEAARRLGAAATRRLLKYLIYFCHVRRNLTNYINGGGYLGEDRW